MVSRLRSVKPFQPTVAYFGSAFFFLQASEQYLTDSQFLAQDFLQVISLLHATQSLLGKELLFPLKVDFILLIYSSFKLSSNLLACS